MLPFAIVPKGRVPAFPDERQERIAAYVSDRGRAHIAELASHFSVTEQTIRKDLRVLQEQSVLKRTHGGAVAMRALVDRDLATRGTTHLEAKQRIAEACLGLLDEGDAAFFDSGSTVSAIARALGAASRSGNSRLRNLSILTSSLEVAREVADLPSIEHVLLGGNLRTQGGAVVGPLTLENLEQFSVEIAFIGVSGFSDAGVSTATLAEAQVKAAAVQRAHHVVVAVDTTKVGANDFARICPLDDIDTAVMDTASPEIEALCESHEVRLIVAGTK